MVTGTWTWVSVSGRRCWSCAGNGEKASMKNGNTNYMDLSNILYRPEERLTWSKVAIGKLNEEVKAFRKKAVELVGSHSPSRLYTRKLHLCKYNVENLERFENSLVGHCWVRTLQQAHEICILFDFLTAKWATWVSKNVKEGIVGRKKLPGEMKKKERSEVEDITSGILCLGLYLVWDGEKAVLYDMESGMHCVTGDRVLNACSETSRICWAMKRWRFL